MAQIHCRAWRKHSLCLSLVTLAKIPAGWCHGAGKRGKTYFVVQAQTRMERMFSHTQIEASLLAVSYTYSMQYLGIHRRKILQGNISWFRRPFAPVELAWWCCSEIAAPSEMRPLVPRSCGPLLQPELWGSISDRECCSRPPAKPHTLGFREADRG